MNQWIVYADRRWASWGWHLTRDEVQPSRYLHPWSLRDFYSYVKSHCSAVPVVQDSRVSSISRHPRFVRPNIGLRKRSRFYCITSSSILVSEIEYVLILLPHHTSKYPQIDLHRCCWNAIFTNVRIYLSYYVILWVKKSKEHKFTGCSYLCFPTWHSVLGDFKTYCICCWSICRAELLDNLLHGHFLLSVLLYYQSSRKYIFLV